MKKNIAILLACILLFSTALPAFAFPSDEDGAEDETYGIAKGYVRTKEIYKRNDGHTQVITSTYNKQGRLVKKTETSKSDDWVYKTVIKNTYDKKGQLTKHVESFNNSVITISYTYDKKGNEIKQVNHTDYWNGDSETETTVSTYNEKNMLTREKLYLDDGVATTTYRYNNKGALMKMKTKTIMDDNRQGTDSITHSYDKAGNTIKTVSTTQEFDGSVQKWVYVRTYNKKNLCTKEVEDHFLKDSNGESDKARIIRTYTYDKHGNVATEKTLVSYSGKTMREQSSVNTYDKKNNLIRQVNRQKDSDGTSKVIISYTYNVNNLLTRYTAVSKNEGENYKVTETYTYDDAGNLTKYVLNSRCADGIQEKETRTYTYQKIGA